MAVPISNVTRRVVYAASGTGPYAFTFEILSNTDIAVYQDDTLLTLTTNYTVTIASNGTGSITLVAAPTGATQIAIVGNRTIQRTTDFVTGGDFFANTVNDEMDQQTIFAQQNAEGLQRALSAPQTDPTTINMTLPRSSVRANKVLGFDGSGNPITTETLGTNRGNWASATIYYIRDIVKDTTNNNIWQCVTQHTSSGSQPIDSNADVAKWSLLVDAATATTSATNAAASASSAAASQATASSAATSATASASTATSAQVATEAARDATLAAFDNFDDRYLGSKSSDPTLDNDGNALVAGSLYFNTVSSAMKVYTGSFWSAAYVSGSGYLASANNLSDISSASTARTNLGLAIGTNVQAYDANLDGWALRKAPTTDGTSGQFLTSSGSGSAPTWTTQAASGTTTATASGSISSNVPVIVNSDGTVSSITGATASAGSLTQSSTTARNGGLYAYDPISGKTLHIAVSSTPTAYVISLSGNTISYGTGNSFASSVANTMNSLVSIGNSKFLTCWHDVNASMLYAMVLTISGTTVTTGTATAIQASFSGFSCVGYDPSTGKAFISYDYSGGVQVGAVLSISGTTITASGYTNLTADGYKPCIAYDSTLQKLIVSYVTATPYLQAKVITISGTTFSVGTASTISTSIMFQAAPRMAYNELTQTMLYFVQVGNSTQPYIVASTQSGTTITFGSYSSVSGFTTGTTNNQTAFIFYIPAAGRVCIVGAYNTGSQGLVYKLLSNSGTTVTQGSFVTLATDQQTFYNPCYGACWDTTNNKAIAYGINTSNYPQSIAFNPDYTSLTSDNFIGLSSGSYTNGQTATVQIVGAVNTGQSSLTTGKKYYVQTNGTLSINPADPSVYAGVATASTKLIVKG